MKVKTISRVEKDFTHEVETDQLKVFRNFDPALHPFERPREYTRALNAVKLDRLFAKPFVGALDGHADGVSALATCQASLVPLVSGASDGEIRIWDLPRTKCVWNCYGHNGAVSGLAVAPRGNVFYSCSEDKTVKQWSLQVQDSQEEEEDPHPLATFSGKEPFLGVDHHWTKELFATCSSKVQIWDPHRSDPTVELAWGVDSITAVKFNPAEVSLLASCATDRNITLHDLRMASSLRKVTLAMRSNALAWNPMEPFNFTVANENHNLYTFDMRRLERALLVHKDHVSAVMDVAYSPTGKEFVAGSYDRTLRIFRVNETKSREVYHAKRMQRLFCVEFSADGEFVLSGSDDTNIRIWKAEANKKLGKITPRERRKLEYNESLKERYQHLREISRIARHRHVPKAIRKATEAKREVSQREKKKMENRRQHSKPGSVPFVNIRKSAIVREDE